MKLHAFQYDVYAQKDGPWYKMEISNPSNKYAFWAHHPNDHWVVVVSSTISELVEEGEAEKAEELREMFTQIFMAHRSAIQSTTARSIEMVKAFCSENL
jgi:hypothetical protein